MATYTIKHFSNWMANYATWAELKDFITSEAGGKLKVIESPDGNEAIIRYDKKTSNMADESVRWCRSVVWDCKDNRPLSVATPKANEETEQFMTMNGSQFGENGFYFEDFIEGVTMNIYKASNGDNSNKVTKVASRTKFGATGNYYSQRSFLDLYHDACTFNGGPSLENYDFMCIIVQHPEHRIVSRISKSAWFPLHAGRVMENGDIEITELTKKTAEQLPENDGSLKKWFAQLTISKGWQWQGLIIKNGTGQRWRLRSNVYKMVRSLRGDTPRSDERFFVLRSNGMIKTYLSYYPEDKQRYWEMESWLRNLTEHIFMLYCGIYKERSVDFANVPKMYQTHLASIHAKYLKNLREKGSTVNKAVVRDYMNALPVPRLLFMLNFDKRSPGSPTSTVI